jgi:ABC-2 type transport system ATP-binding protein
MLEVNQLGKTFGKLKVLQDVSFTVQPGEIMGLIGQNGAGKSTTFHSILQFLHYDGQITWQQQPITEAVFDTIGYLPEERSLMPKLTVAQQILYLARLKNQTTKTIRAEIGPWLDRFEVKGQPNSKIKELSKGNQQKVQLICTLIHQPKLIILDEPFSGLDPVNVALLEQAILNARDQGAAIIFSSHDMGNVSALCDHLVMLNRGKMVLHGGLQAIREQFGKTVITVTTDWSVERLQTLPTVTNVQPLTPGRYRLIVSDPAAGPAIFQALSQGQYIEEFSQQPPSLDQIFKLKAGAAHA